MMHGLDVAEKLDRAFLKLGKKDRKKLEQINKKVLEIRENPNIGKPLKKPMQGRRRVHIGSFILFYSVDEVRRVVKLLDYDHHDKAY
jgi:mRNA-degrading endonuclease RelE of RelBE toxin-antitoxin system